ncbi:phosphoadenylyl-sulfate reductase [Melioribacter sp. OK-6-Me]|uniref:phosphoadenylyl-sulfate reductase n=1 Tax=unclassified Melioribacter TaxID=2627329 RepID=UPI003ED94F30
MKGKEILAENLNNLDAFSVLKKLIESYGNRVVFSTSFSIEDQVITDMLTKITPKPNIFTLDTGRLHEATYKTLELTREHYNIDIKIYFPDYNKVEEMVFRHGVNLFYKSVDLRKYCCSIRKLEPLSRALRNAMVWITGLRREQSITRKNIELVEEDNLHGVIKINPLYNWSETEVWNYIRTQNIPYNSLYEKGYTSIGCEPCTRPIQPGEETRAGRWWWEHPETKECGLHIKQRENQ